MADFDPSDRTQPLHAPSAPLSADEIAEMRARVNAASSEEWSERNGWLIVRGRVIGLPLEDDARFITHARGDVLRLLDAVEALAADRDRLRDALNQTVQEACAAIDDELKPEVERLKEYVLASEYWRLEPHDQKERSAFIRRLNADHAAAKEAAE